MAISQTEANIVLGSNANTKQAKVGIPAGPDGEDPGLLFLESVNSGATTYAGLYLWADSANVLRYSTTIPTDEDSSGSALDSTTAASAANKALSNLASVAVNTNIASDTDSTDNLGSSSIYWANTYTDNLYVNSTAYLAGGTAGSVVCRGNLVMGVTGTGADITMYGDNYDVIWDASEDTLEVLDNAIIAIGTGDDITIAHDGTDTHIEGKAADEILQVGDTNTIDLFLHGANDFVHLDASADLLRFSDTMILGFGTGGSTDYDIGLAFAAAGTLSWTQKVSGTGSILKGVDDKGIDETWYAETGSDYMKWDQDGGTGNVGALVFEDSLISIAGANVTYELGISTDTLLITGTDHANNNVTFGNASQTNSTDVTFQTATAGNLIKFDAGAETWTVTDAQVVYTGADSTGTLLTITGIDTTGNTDSVAIVHSGTGAGLKISCSETDSLALELLAKAAQTTSVQWIDGSTADWDGADDVGMLHLTADAPAIHAGATMLYAANSGQNIAAAEGSVARFLDTGTAQASTYGVEISSTNNTALHLTTGAVGATQMQATAFAAQTTAVIDVDLDTNNWDGADNIGAITIVADDPFIHAGATCLYVGNAGQNIIAAEGSCARFLDTGTARASTYGVQIDSTNNTALHLTGGAVGSTQALVTPFAAQTTSAVTIGGGADWDGADDIGMLHVNSDTAQIHAGASNLVVLHETAQPITAAQGFLARFLDTGTARTNAYGVEIGVTATTGALHVSSGHVLIADKLTATTGVQSVAQAVVATATGATTGTIADGVSHCTVTVTTDANDIVVLPTPTAGTVVWLHSAAVAFELRSSDPSTVLINGGAGGAAVESAVATTDYVTRCVCMDSTHWICSHFAAAGTESAADAAAA